jgi:hypothetical protein
MVTFRKMTQGIACSEPLLVGGTARFSRKTKKWSPVFLDHALELLALLALRGDLEMRTELGVELSGMAAQRGVG